MHAPLILLDGYLALRTWFGVELHPYLRVVATLVDSVEPLNQLVASNRSMGLPQALKAPVGPTFLTNDVALLHRGVLIADLASFARTPFRALVDVNEGLGVVIIETTIVQGGEGLLEELIGNYQFARCAGANGVDAVLANIELALEIVGVAVSAEVVAALTHPHNLVLVIIADLTKEG